MIKMTKKKNKRKTRFSQKDKCSLWYYFFHTNKFQFGLKDLK